jgi:SAM-dependent methyltransferase
MTVEETLPFPPDEYMTLVCGRRPAPELRNHFREVGLRLVGTLDQQRMLGEDIRLLDIGCGCGRVARYLLERPLASYVGFDRHRGMIDWCLQEIASRSSKFNFIYFGIKSAYQNIDGQEGEISAREFRFPFENHAFDSVLLASVFTHMPMSEIYNYLYEIYRVLSPRGRVLLSVFFSNNEDEITNSEGVDFLLPKKRFLNGLGISHFHYTMLAIAGAHHNWYVLRPLPIEFDPRTYLAIHKDVADAGMDPAQHYLFCGRDEGRRLR